MYWSGRAAYCGGDRAGLRNRSEARRLPSTTTGSGLKAIHDRKTFSSRACSCRDYGKHGHDRRRGNDCVDRNAADRGAAGSAQSLLLGFLVISFDTDSNDGRVWQTGRHLRAQAGACFWYCAVPDGFGAGRFCVVDAFNDCFPAVAGHRGGGNPARGHDRCGRSFPRSTAQQGSGVSCKCLGVVSRRRSVAWQSHHSQFELGLGILD